MYHALEDAARPAGSSDQGEQLYVLQADAFREQMAYLQREKYRALLLEELGGLEALPERPVLITFDDGHVSNHAIALPLLKQYGLKAEFFITTDWIGTERFMSADQVADLPPRRSGSSPRQSAPWRRSSAGRWRLSPSPAGGPGRGASSWGGDAATAIC